MDDKPWPRTRLDRLLSRATDAVQRRRGMWALFVFAWVVAAPFRPGDWFTGWTWALVWLPVNTIAAFAFGSILARWVTKDDHWARWDD